jgi:outer membrane protein assembly factor BamB
LLAVAGSSRTIAAASPSLIAATGSGGVSESEALAVEVSGSEVGELMLTVSLLSFDQRRFTGLAIVIPGSSRGKRRSARGRHIYFPGVGFASRHASALLTPVILISLIALAGCSNSKASSPPQKVAQQAEELPPPSATPDPGPTLSPTALPGVLPGNLLIADRANNRVIEVSADRKLVWEFPRPGDLQPGQHFRWPDDAFYAPDGKSIVVNEEESHAIVLIDYATHRIVWQYGVSERHGSAKGYLNGPDDAYMWPDGSIGVADIRNCRLILIDQASKAIKAQLGRTGYCAHNPPKSFGLPNGDAPLDNGHVLTTEILGSWVSELGWDGTLYWTVRAPGIRYPSDAQMLPDGNILLVDYSRPGQILIMTRQGKPVWRYAPRSGPAMLDHPSLAIELSNGLIALNDDFRHRVLVIDPKTDTIVWQYGINDRRGRTDGLLFIPDGIDIKPVAWGAG